MILLTNREKQILEIIKKDPLLSQDEIAKKVGISRSSVAVHITNLTKKGYIIGRGYVLSVRDYVTVIGAANVDIQGFSEEKIIYKDSNPGKIEICLGGVSRNIAENLVKLDIETKLVTATGGDLNSQRLIKECINAGIDMSHTLVLENMNASIYLAIMDDDGEMVLGLSDMSVLDKMTPDFIKSKSYILGNSRAIVIDAALPKDVIEYILLNFKDKKVFLDPVSVKKSRSVKDLIGKFHTIKLNKLEAQYLSNMVIETKKDLKDCADYFIEEGVKQVFITLGERGVFYSNGDYHNLLKAPRINVQNATGAGDAFMAAIVYCVLKDFNIDYTAKFATSASILTLQSEKTVSDIMCIENVTKIIEEMF